MFGKECAHASLAAELLKALLWEEAPKEGGLAKTQSLRTIGEWLFALLRRHRVPYSRLSGIVEKIAESAREPAIAGRMYRRIGMSTQWVGNDGFLVTLLLLPTSGSFIEGEDANVIASWIRAEPYEAHKFLRHLGELLERLEGAEFERIYKGFMESLCAISESGEFAQTLSKWRQTLKDVVEKTKKAVEEVIGNEPVDEAQADNLGQEVTETLVQGANGRHLFQRLFAVVRTGGAAVGKAQKKEVVCVKPRAEFIERGRETASVIRGRSIMRLVCEGDMAQAILGEALTQLQLTEKSVKTPTDWWEESKAFVAYTKSAGLEPVCLLPLKAPDWMWCWVHASLYVEAAKPSDLTVWQDRKWEGANGYWANLGDLPVFRCLRPEPGSYLLARESLATVTFLHEGDGKFIKATVVPDQEDVLTVNVRLVWYTNMEVMTHPALRLVYA